MKPFRFTYLLLAISGSIACSAPAHCGVVIEYPGMDALIRDSDAIVVATAPKPVPPPAQSDAEATGSWLTKISGLPDYAHGARTVVLIQKTLKGTLEEGTTVSVYLPADDRSFGVLGVGSDPNFFSYTSTETVNSHSEKGVKKDFDKVMIGPDDQEAWDKKFPFPPHSVGSIFGPKVHGESELLFLQVTNNTPSLETFPCVGSHLKVDETKLKDDLSDLDIRQAVEALIEK